MTPDHDTDYNRIGMANQQVMGNQQDYMHQGNHGYPPDAGFVADYNVNRNRSRSRSRYDDTFQFIFLPVNKNF